MAKDTFYFPHDYNARNDVKCLFLRQLLGMEGYGIFWFLVESLADAGGILPIKIIPVLAMQMQVPDAKVSSVIQNFELFEITDDSFFSARLNTHLNLRKTLSEKGREGAASRWKNGEANGGAIALPNGEAYAKERKGNERKVKESKESKGKDMTPPTQQQVVDFFSEKGYTSESAKKAHDYYASNDWKDGKNNPVRNWKQKMIAVWMKPENKMPEKQGRTIRPSDYWNRNDYIRDCEKAGITPEPDLYAAR